MRVRVLGGLVVEDVDLARFGSRKARRVLARLVVARGGAVGADTLAEVVWGPDQPSQPADQLSVLVSRLRSVVGGDRLVRTAAGYALRTDWLDLTALAELAGEARRRLDTGAVAPATVAARAALDLIRGPVLPEEPDDTDWLMADRAGLARQAATARLVAASAALAGGDAFTAVAFAEECLDAEPYDEAALRVLMSAHQAAGRPALALRAYAELADRLRDELGVDPAAETRAVHLRLLRADPTPGHGATRPAAPGPGRTAADLAELPGRSVELAELAAALDRAAAGPPQLVVVEGEAGIGKTRLLAEFGRGLTGSATVLWCRADEHSGGLPLQPLLDALAARLRTGTDDPDALLAGAAATVRGLLGPLGPVASAAISRAAADGGPGPAGGTGLAEVFAGYDTVLARLAGAGAGPVVPVVLVIDDVQWADPATRAFLAHAVRRGPAGALLILAGLRSGEGEPVPADRVLRLGPLDRAATATVLGQPVGSPVVQALYERSGGHPMFLAELARAGLEATTVQHGYVSDAAGAGTSDGTAGSGALPASIRESVIERAARAGPEVAATLRAAAVLGPDVDLELLAAVLDAPVATLLDHLEEGVRRHLLVESGVGFGFAHQLVREALRTGASGARVVLLHRQAARILAGRAQADPLAAAYHARLGGDPATAATALARAGEIAAGRFDLVEAVRLLDRAVAEHDGNAVRIRRARIRLRASDAAGAADDAAVVRGRVDAGDPDHAAALEIAALVAYLARDFDRAFRFAEEGAAVAADPEVRASCLGLAGRIRHGVGDLVEARERLDRAGAQAPASSAPVLDLWRGFLLVHMDDPATALRLVGTAEPVQVRVGYPFAAPSRHQVAGHAHALRGEPLAALAEFERMAQAADRLGTPHFAGRDDNFRAWILRNLGAVGAADDANQRAYEQASTHGLAEPQAHALLDLADGRLRAGDPAAAQAYLDQLRPGSYAFQWRAELRRTLLAGRLALALGDAGAAAETFEAVRVDAERLSLRRYGVLARLGLARAEPSTRVAGRPEAIASDVDSLVTVAPLEAWWMTAELARAFAVPAWETLAQQRVEALAAKAGPYGGQLRAAFRSAARGSSR